MNADRLQRFTGGESFAVDPDAIERELAALWRTAGQGGASGAPVTRACLLNVVAHIEERETLEGYGSAETVQRWVDELPRHVAARSLIVRSQPFRASQRELQSWISANCIIAGGGGKLVCSEEVTIAARGHADHHVPALARALLVPGLPTSLLFRGIPYGALAGPLLALSDRVVTDLDASGHASPISELANVVRASALAVMDIGWVGTAAVRSALASAFDPPFDGTRLLSVEAIECVTPPEVQWTSRVLTAWLANGLGAREADPKSQGLTQFSRDNGVPLAVRTTVDAEAPGPTFSFTHPEWSEPVQVRCLGSHIEVVGPHLATARRPRQELEGAAALARALTYYSEDTAFRQALRTAEAVP